MPRINVEDDLDKDPRFRTLVRLLQGDDERALGMLFRFWQAAQVRWKRGELIPEDVFAAGGWEAILEAGLAVRRDGGIYARGAEVQFRWLTSRSKAGRSGGISSGETRRKQTQAKGSKRKVNKVDAVYGGEQISRRTFSASLADESPFDVEAAGRSAALVEWRPNAENCQEKGATNQTQANPNKSEQAEASASKAKPHAPSHTLSPEQSPLSPPEFETEIDPEPGTSFTKRETERALKDRAVRAKDAILAVATKPPRGPTAEDAYPEICRRIPPEGRVVVERIIGEGPEGWPMYLNTLAAKHNSRIGATNELAQLRDSILAELRRSPEVEL